MSQKNDRGKILFFRESTFKITEIIFNYPNRTFHVRMLGKETGFSTTAVIRSVEELEKFNIVKAEKTPITTNIAAKTDSDAYVFYKKVFNLYRMKRYGFINNLKTIFGNPKTIAIFGSFARGEDTENSSIDLLVISHNKNPERLDKLKDMMEELFKRKINVHVLPSLDKSSPEFRNAVANGVVLHGYLKVM